MNIYAVHDIKAEAYLQPFFAQTDGLAIRMFQAAANDQEHQFWKYAEDYTLFNIGVWDEKNGVLHSSTKEPLGTAVQYKDTTDAERYEEKWVEQMAKQEAIERRRDGEEIVKQFTNSISPQKNPESS